MTPKNSHLSQRLAGSRPHGRTWVCVLVVAVMSVLSPASSDAQRRRKRPPKSAPAPASAPADDTPRSGPADPEQSDLASPGEGEGDGSNKGAKVRTRGGKSAKTQVFDFTGLNLSGSERKPQLLYFLDRAQAELKRASLERRSFVPEMVRSVNEEAL